MTASIPPPDTGAAAQTSGAPAANASRRLLVILLAVVLVVAGVAVGFVLGSGGDDAAPQATASQDTEPTAPPTGSQPTGTPPSVEGEEPAAPTDVAVAGAEARDASYCEIDGVDLKMDFFRPDTDDVTPLVIFVHGGGWTDGDKAQLGQLDAFEPMLEAGYSVATVNYRLAPEFTFPAQIIDVKCAIRHLRANADAYGVDPERFALMGFSAGAHLAALAAVAGESAGFDVGPYEGVPSTVVAMTSFEGQADITDLRTEHPDIARGVFGGTDQAMEAASPVAYLDPEDPAFLIFQGTLDQVVPLDQGQKLAAGLDPAGVENTLVTIEGGQHRVPEGPDYTAQILDFLAAHLG